MLRTLAALCAFAVVSILLSNQSLSAAELTTKEVLDQKGDGPDGQGNTADDTWQFWFQFAHNKNQYGVLDLYSANVPKGGINRKVTGPIASKLKNPDDTVGWIYHSDWDGRMEGAWADKKTGLVMLHPYVEKRTHGAVAVSYKVPEDGKYHVTGKVKDLMVEPFKGVVGRLGMVEHDGFEWMVEIAEAGNKVKDVAKGGPYGDGDGRADGGDVDVKVVEAKKGQLIRLVISPRNWWGSDLTAIENLKIEKQ